MEYASSIGFTVGTLTDCHVEGRVQQISTRICVSKERFGEDIFWLM